jgi:exopolyphosphatase/guanosine-5'-triphosphate,3'-diphosphate pyrophosphatase
VTEAVAALDCGSNSTRLLVADERGSTLVREMRITRLSQGVDATSTLTDEALERTFGVLREYRDEMDRFAVSRGLLVATSAVRDASNGAHFLHEAQRITGVEARVLSGNEEAAYTFAGATRDLAPDPRPTIVLDIGGGSTEMALRVDGALFSFSMQLGCVRVTERALGRGVVNASSEAAAREMIETELDRAFAAVPAFGLVAGNVRLVGVAGTVSTLAQLEIGTAHYDRDAVHHRRIMRTSVEAWRDRLARESPEERLARPGMVRGREDVLHSGLYVLDAVMERLQVDQLLSSENDILDGIVAAVLDL